MSDNDFITLSADEHYRIKDSGVNTLVIEKNTFEGKDIIVFDKGEAIAKINLEKDGIRIKGENIIVNGERIYNPR